MSVSYKMERVRRLAPVLGVVEALRFEALWTLRQPSIGVFVPELGRRVRIRRGEADYTVLEEVLLGRECDIQLAREPRVIVDAGANIGITTVWFAVHYPGAKVIAIEPAADNLRLLRAHCEGLPNVCILEGAVWPESGWVRITNPAAAPWAFQVLSCERTDPGAIRAYAVQDALAAAGVGPEIDLFKCDIEGAETQLFSRATDWLDRTHAVSIETHGADAEEAVRRATAARGFACTQQGEKLWLVR